MKTTLIIISIVLLFITGLTTIALLNPAKPTQQKQFTGISATGHTYINNQITGTIPNH